MSSFTFKPGEYNRAAGTRDAFGALSDELVAAGYPPMLSISGDREIDAQLVIWYQRMVPRGQENGRRVYGSVKWNGITWSRIHPDMVAIPDASNHVKRRANDLAAPYNSDTAAHRAAQKLAKKHNITCAGLGFREPWHWEFGGALGVIGSAATSSTTKPSTPPAAPIKPTNLEVPMAFDMTRPIYRHTGINKFIVLDLLNKTCRIIEPTDWEQTLINEENSRRLDFVKNIEKRAWHVTDGVHRDITPEQWAAAFNDFRYVN